jgi:hypothetical protein
MAVTIKGIRLEDVSLHRKEGGDFEIANSNYSLISSADKVLAKQTIGGYGGMVLQPSPVTVKALNDFIDSYRKDVHMVLGLE